MILSKNFSLATAIPLLAALSPLSLSAETNLDDPLAWEKRTAADECVSKALYKSAMKKIGNDPTIKEIFLSRSEIAETRAACTKSTGEKNFYMWDGDVELRLKR